jgi:hypothetical protein
MYFMLYFVYGLRTLFASYCISLYRLHLFTPSSFLSVLYVLISSYLQVLKQTNFTITICIHLYFSTT